MNYKKIGFIGQGFVGGNLADNYEGRGYKEMMVRYDLSPKYVGNKSEIRKCDLVFIAVPTPSTPEGFDDSILFNAIASTSPGTVIVIKSTVPPEIIRDVQYFYADRIIMLCPEFLTEATARFDTDKPERNMIGIANIQVPELIEKAQAVVDTLPVAPYNKICTYEEASLAKYAGNCFFVLKNMFFNVLYDLAESYGADWETLHDMIIHDNRINQDHTNVLHKGGRGAGGHCLIKDFAAFNGMVKKHLPEDKLSKRLVDDIVKKNIDLLKASGKDKDLLEGVYGVEESVIKKLLNLYIA